MKMHFAGNYIPSIFKGPCKQFDDFMEGREPFIILVSYYCLIIGGAQTGVREIIKSKAKRKRK